MKKNYKVSVVGQGYVGLPLALAASKAGHEVTGIEIDRLRLRGLQQGDSPIEDVSSAEIQLQMSSSLRFEGDYKSVETSDIVIICVPTPLKENQEPDLVPLQSSVSSIAPLLKSGALLINESTSFPGTVRDFIIPLIENVRHVKDLFFASAPERIDPGNLNWNLGNTPRLIGGIDARSQELAMDFYRSFCSQVIGVSTPEIAETAKLLENTYRQVNIALINQIHALTRKLDINTIEVIEAAATKPYGFMPFYPSAGVGGHCIPVDPMYLLWKGKKLQVKIPLVEIAQKANDSRPIEIVEKIGDLLGAKTKKILVVGIGYKPKTADTRESAGVKIYLLLKEIFIKVDWYDPYVIDFDGKVSVSEWESYDCLVIVHDCGGLPMAEMSKTNAKILDCSGKFPKVKHVTQV